MFIPNQTTSNVSQRSSQSIADAPDESIELAERLLARARVISQQTVERVKQLHIARFHQINITIVDGWKREQCMIFNQRQLCLIGRADDCDIRFPRDVRHRHISHHHCVLEIDPPFVAVRDMGSTNGTYVNGWKVDKQLPDVILGQTHFSGLILLKGDEIGIGPARLRIGIEEDPGEVDLNEIEFDTES